MKNRSKSASMPNSVPQTLAVAALIVFSLAIPPVSIASGTTVKSPLQGQEIPNPIVQGGWKVYWQITKDNGLAVQNVTYMGEKILKEGLLPGIYVTYLSSICIFYDEIGYAPPNETNATQIMNATLTLHNISLKTSDDGGFTLIGKGTVPNYDYTQIWVFFPDGRFMPLLNIGPKGCLDIRTYEVRWRLTFDLGHGGETAYTYANGVWSPVRTESEVIDSGLRDHANSFTNWMISDGLLSYHFAPYDSPDAPTAPPRLLVLFSHPNEIEKSHFPGVVTPKVYLNGERVYMTNVTLWYISQHTYNPYLYSAYNVTTGLVFYHGGF